MKNKLLYKALAKAYKLLEEADSAVSKLNTFLCFEGFEENNVPLASSCNGSNEIILEFNGSEIFIEDAISIMEEKGYISPDDFL